MARVILLTVTILLALSGCTFPTLRGLVAATPTTAEGQSPVTAEVSTMTTLASPASATATISSQPPTSTPGAPSPTITIKVEAPSASAGDAVLAACPADQQALPFRDDLQVDLSTLQLNLCYDLTFELDDDGESFDAVARVTVRNGSGDSWPDLLFRLYPESPLLFGGEYEVGSVSVDGIQVEAERVLEDDTGLRVSLPAPLEPGVSTLVEIEFEGELATNIGGSQRVYGIFARTGAAATIASWFPLLAVWDAEANRWYDVPVLGEGDAVFSESAFIRASLSAPDHFELAASGLIVSEESADGRATYQVVTGPARDLTMVWMEGYRQESIEVDGTTVRNWFLPGHETGAGLAFEAAHESLAIFNEHFGPYPFEEVEVVEVPLSGAGGVEYPQLFLLGQELYGNQGSHDFLAFASAHEMAHQWWYSTVGNDINAAPWQDEALTNWSAVFWLEKESESAARATLDGYRQAFEGFEAVQGEEAITQPLEAFQGRSSAYGTIVYLKGALFFQAVREEIGDDDFFDALSDYYEAHQFDLAEPEALLAAFEERSGRALDALYAEWGVSP